MADQRLYALFQDVSDAERAIGALQDRGIARDQISVLTRRAAEQDVPSRVHTDYTRVTDPSGENIGEPEAAYQPVPGFMATDTPAVAPNTLAPTNAVDTVSNVESVGKEGITTTTPQDAAAGAAVGSGVGLVAGLLLGAAALAVPGVGLVLAGGALASAIGAAAATAAAGAVAGGVTGYLRDMGMTEPAAQHAADRLHEGDYLLTLVADSGQYDDIKQLLLKYNAVGVDINVAAPSIAGAAHVPTTPPAPPELSDVTTLRVPANPALAQETEPITNIHNVPPPLDDAEMLEQSRTTQREVRDSIS